MGSISLVVVRVVLVVFFEELSFVLQFLLLVVRDVGRIVVEETGFEGESKLFVVLLLLLMSLTSTRSRRARRPFLPDRRCTRVRTTLIFFSREHEDVGESFFLCEIEISGESIQLRSVPFHGELGSFLMSLMGFLSCCNFGVDVLVA